MPPNAPHEASHRTSAEAVAATAALVQKTVAPFCADTQRYALIDFPDHPNVGDSAIWGGEEVLFAKLFGRRPDYVCALYDYSDRLVHAVPEGELILMHGGGNFGDVWPAHQAFRERILETYPRHRIVQLPQSLHFADPAARDRCARVITAHPDFTLLVRDRQSYDFATAHFDCPVHLCPDSAYVLGASTPPAGPGEGTLCLLRTDHERRGDSDRLSAFEGVARIDDWLEEPPVKSPLDRALGRLGRLGPLETAMMGHRAALYQRVAATRIDRGLRQLSGADIVVTDRLHGHILCMLLGRTHIVIDNHYRKIGNFIDAWGACDSTHRAESYGEARAILDGLRSSAAQEGAA